MSTIVCFHAHPDDEAIATGGTMLLASQAGHRVVLVMATRGERGEPVSGVLEPGEELWQRRVAETHASAEILGVQRVEFLGYEDSGMVDEASNANPDCFWQADVHEAATRLAAILQEERADVLTIYDPHGGYGHPDHIQVHRVGAEAGELAGIERVYWSTMNRTHIKRLIAEAPEGFESDDDAPVDPDQFGMPEAQITHSVDVSGVIETKRRSMAAHASQISPDDFFLTLPDDAFAAAFGTEWYVSPLHQRNGGEFLHDLFG